MITWARPRARRSRTCPRRSVTGAALHRRAGTGRERTPRGGRGSARVFRSRPRSARSRRGPGSLPLSASVTSVSPPDDHLSARQLLGHRRRPPPGRGRDAAGWRRHRRRRSPRRTHRRGCAARAAPLPVVPAGSSRASACAATLSRVTTSLHRDLLGLQAAVLHSGAARWRRRPRPRRRGRSGPRCPRKARRPGAPARAGWCGRQAPRGEERPQVGPADPVAKPFLQRGINLGLGCARLTAPGA